MHGRVKVKTTAQQQEEKRIEREKKLALYKAATDRIYEKRSKDELDKEMLLITAGILQNNPDDASLWNIRREVFIRYKEEGKDVDPFTKDELLLTQQGLMKNYKSYGSWWHRGWVMLNLPKEPDWKRELVLCGLFFEKDDRNFHCWDYRRFVCQHCKFSLEDELTFSRERIDSNFSNYSSWHYRSHLLPRIYPATETSIREDILLQELDLVINAAFTDPQDQSAWMYHRWLLGRSDPAVALTYARWYPTDGELVVNFSVQVAKCSVEVFIGGKPYACMWKPLTGAKASPVWTCEDNTGLINATALQLKFPPVDITLTLKDPEWHSGSKMEKNAFAGDLSSATTRVLREQLENSLQLVEMEPDCRWPLLTSVLLMRSLDAAKYHKEALELLNKLQEMDPKRKNYYSDLRSKFVIEYNLHSLENFKDVDFSRKSLSCLRHAHLLLGTETLNLSFNQLRSENLKQLRLCPRLRSLNVSHNPVINLDFLEAIPKLQKLSIVGCDLGDVSGLRCCPNLSQVEVAATSNEDTSKSIVEILAGRAEIVRL